MSQTKSVLCFVYKDSKGLLTKRQIANWGEAGDHISGIQVPGRIHRTFIKDRIVKYFDNEDAWVESPLPTSSPAPEKKSEPSEQDLRPQITFTGFDYVRRPELEAMADEAGLWVRKSVTKKLSYLVTGEEASWDKTYKASGQGCWILDERQFLLMLETGELPEKNAHCTTHEKQLSQ